MNQRRGGLGRGLDALIPTGAGKDEKQFALIPIDEIKLNPKQPRKTFKDEGIDALAESISIVGVLQPIVVTPEGKKFTIVAGERRWRAAKKAGLTEIPAMIRDVDDRAALTQALIENVQREDLSPLEEAAGLQQLLEEHGLTHEALGAQIGKSRTAITNSVRLLSLPPVIQGLLSEGAISAGHGRALVGLGDRKFAEHIANKAAQEGWSVRQLEEAVRARKDAGRPDPNAKPVLKEIRPVEILELEQRLTELLAAKVKISYRAKKGKVEISFKSLDDLERLYRHFFS